MKNFFALAFVVLFSSVAMANPLLGGSAPVEQPSALEAHIAHIQADINRHLNEILGSMQGDVSALALWTAILLSFAYGVLHALGPGHAKTIIASYMLTHRAKARDGVWIALRFAVTHVAGAFAIALALFLLQRSLITAGQETLIINVLCYSIIALIGFSLLIRAIRPSADCCDHDHSDSAHSHSHDSEKKQFRKTSWGVAVMAGLLPCPGPILVLLYALTIDKLLFGMGLALIMALGMALTIGVVAIATIYTRHGVMHLSKRQLVAARYLQRALLFLGGSLITAFALWQLSQFLG